MKKYGTKGYRAGPKNEKEILKLSMWESTQLAYV